MKLRLQQTNDGRYFFEIYSHTRHVGFFHPVIDEVWLRFGDYYNDPITAMTDYVDSLRAIYERLRMRMEDKQPEPRNEFIL